MSSTTTLRHDTARSGTTPNFPIHGNPWRKYVSLNLGAPVRAGVLVVENWLFNAGPHNQKTYTLVLVATTNNEVFCYSEGALLAHGTGATPLWHTPLGVPPSTRGGSNIAPPLGVCGTPVVDTANRRMFVVALHDVSGHGKYTIFEISLDTGNITTSRELVDAGATGRATFNPDVLDQRTAINLVDGWLWLGFADFFADDISRYYGWVVAVRADDLRQQLYQPMVSRHSSNTWGIFAGGVWGPGGVAAAADGTVFALTGNAIQLAPGDTDGTHPHDDLTSFGMNYWGGIPSTGPGSVGDYFNGLVRLGITVSGTTPELTVLDWFQGSDITQSENAGDLDFGGSSPVVLPPIDGRQLVAFIPKDGNIFVLDSQNLGHFTPGLTRVPFGDPSKDTKVAIAYMRTPDGRNILIVGADTSGTKGGLAAYALNGAVTPPTLTQLWHAAAPLRDSFGSPTVVANPVPDPAHPPSPLALTWVIDGDPTGNFLHNCAMRAYEPVSGAVVYDSTTHNDVTEQIPHFAPITAGANSVFCATSTGFMGFTQFVAPPKTLEFIIDRSTFGKDEVDAKEPTPTSVASFTPAYWIAVSGVLPDDLDVTRTHLAPSQTPSITPTFASNLSSAQVNAIKAMLNAGQFTGSVVPQNAAVPDEPQGFLLPYTIAFTGDNGFVQMAASHPPVNSTIVTLDASLTVGGTVLTNSGQIELTTGADPFFIDVDPHDPTQPTWLSFDLRLFRATENAVRFGVSVPNDPRHVPGFIQQVIANLNANHGNVSGDSFDGLTQNEHASGLEWNPQDNFGHNVFNFAVARVRLVGKTTGPTPSPVRVFFRLFQAQNTVSNFDTNTTYRTWADNTPPHHKIALLGVHNNEYVTIPCFATKRVNLDGPASMHDQKDPPNACPITITAPGVEVDAYFGCWIDNNQPNQNFLPSSPPPASQGGLDGPWTSQSLHSIHGAISAAPHQCLVAEINYDDAPVIPNATTGSSDKLAQRNIAWIPGPNPGQLDSRRMTHPVQLKPTPQGAHHPDELMIFWGHTPRAGDAQLFLPALDASAISDLANRLRPWQHTWMVDPHTIGFRASGVTFLPLPSGVALIAGLLTVTLPAGVHHGDSYTITVRQLTDDLVFVPPPPPPPPPPPKAPARRASKRAQAAAAPTAIVVTPQRSQKVLGAFQFGINISTKEAILLGEERLLATLRWLELQMPTQKRWYPVLLRYIEYVAGRVAGFGGDPTKILPSPTGWVPGLPSPKHHPGGPGGGHGGGVEHFEGKIQGLIFDHFGDFDGFVIETQAGHHTECFSREHAVRELAYEAQQRRKRVRVTVEHDRHIRRLVIL